MTSAVEKRRSSDAVSFSRKVVHAIGNVLRVTNRGILTLLGRKVNGVHRPVDPQSLSLLREHILGNRKDAIIDVFGLPPKVQASDGTVIQSDDPLNADTWYFPLDPVRGTILVVHFEDDLAADAQFVDAPQIK
jgi:hypothetical protein